MPTKTGKKYLICDAAPSNWGKTTTLHALIALFKAHPTIFKIITEQIVSPADHWIVLQEIATSKTILIQTQGDYGKSFDETKNYLANDYDVDIIICAARSKGASLQAVQFIESTYNYEQIQFSNFCPLDRNLFSIPAISDVNNVHLAQLIYNFAIAL